MVYLLSRKHNFKTGANTGLPISPYITLVIFDYFPGNRKSYSCSGVFCFLMKTFKHVKYFSRILLLEAYSIVGDLNKMKSFVDMIRTYLDASFSACNSFRPDFDDRGHILFTVL